MNKTMNNKENKKENTSLLRKTKAQLVEIILRKDEVEQKLRNEHNEEINKRDKDTKQLLDSKSKFINKYTTLKTEYTCLKEDYANICDENIIANLKIKTKDNFIKILYIILFISIVLNIGLFMV